MRPTGDPIADYAAFDREQARLEASLPRCDCCDEVMDDWYYEIEGDRLCLDCVKNRYIRSVE